MSRSLTTKGTPSSFERYPSRPIALFADARVDSVVNDTIVRQTCIGLKGNGAVNTERSRSQNCSRRQGDRIVRVPWRLGVISGSADHVDGLPRARPVYLSKRTRFAPAAEGSALGQKRLRVLPMARKRNGGRSAIP